MVGPCSLTSTMGTLFLYQFTEGTGKPLGGSQNSSALVPNSTRSEVGEVTNCLRISKENETNVASTHTHIHIHIDVYTYTSAYASNLIYVHLQAIFTVAA